MADLYINQDIKDVEKIKEIKYKLNYMDHNKNQYNPANH